METSSEWTELTVGRSSDVVDSNDSRLPVWRVSVDVEAPPEVVLEGLRSLSGVSSTVIRRKTLSRPSEDVDVVEYAVTLPTLDRPRYFNVIQYVMP